MDSVDLICVFCFRCFSCGCIVTSIFQRKSVVFRHYFLQDPLRRSIPIMWHLPVWVSFTTHEICPCCTQEGLRFRSATASRNFLPWVALRCIVVSMLLRRRYSCHTFPSSGCCVVPSPVHRLGEFFNRGFRIRWRWHSRSNCGSLKLCLLLYFSLYQIIPVFLCATCIQWDLLKNKKRQEAEVALTILLHFWSTVRFTIDANAKSHMEQEPWQRRITGANGKESLTLPSPLVSFVPVHSLKWTESKIHWGHRGKR